MKPWLFRVSILCLFFSTTAFPSGISAEAETILELEFLAMRVLDIESNMRFLITRTPKGENVRPRRAQGAIDDLEAVQEDVQELAVSRELMPLRRQFGDLITSLQSIYSGIDKKEDDAIKAGYEAFGTQVRSYNADLAEKIDVHLDFPGIGVESRRREAMLKTLPYEEDKRLYTRLESLVEARKYRQALPHYRDMWERYRGTRGEGIIAARLVECEQKRDAPAGVESERLIRTLQTLINRGTYYPNLPELFVQWRTLTQAVYHGQSNMSPIPNGTYRRMRRRTAATLVEHINGNPNDAWARRQLALLLDIPLIARGGRFGNTNLTHWGLLFSDILNSSQGDAGE